MIDLEILYNKLDCPSLLPFLESVELVDVAASAPSTLSLTLCNADGRFSGSWAATKGDSISVKIPPAGVVTFAINAISVQISPRMVTWRAQARPAVKRDVPARGAGFPPPKEGALVSEKRSWNNMPLRGDTFQDVAWHVCSECGLELRYIAKSNPVIKHVVRYDETGFHLLTRLARRFGLRVRASAGAVSILGGTSKSDAKPPESYPVGLDRVESLASVDAVEPSKVRSARLSPRDDKTVEFSAGDGDGPAVAVDFDAADPLAIYDGAVANVSAAELSVIPDPRIVAGCIIKIFGELREVTEMRYTRTGSDERMTLKTKASK